MRARDEIGALSGFTLRKEMKMEGQSEGGGGGNVGANISAYAKRRRGARVRARQKRALERGVTETWRNKSRK